VRGGMIEPIRVFIGFDRREAIAYHVCVQSILEHTDQPVAFYPIWGERRDGSNDFIYSRFMVPYLCGFMGKAIFLDGDMIVRTDIAELWGQDVSYCGVKVVKHDYKTRFPTKYLGNKNEDYPRKNWSSVILWNNAYWPHRALTPEFVATQPGEFLHRFAWLKDEQIGDLDKSWNRLCLEQDMAPDDKLRHYTIGTPCFAEYADSDPEWHKVYKRAIAPC
jgi:lipopolysaccharide biosynthesis glycosyltransferase